MKLFEKITNPRDIRRKLGMNQQDFWSRIGVTQSGGSRYESGRNMPRPVRELLRIVHVEQVDLGKIKSEDFGIAERLKQSNPRLYNALRQELRAKPMKKPAGKRR
jgi:transcriptional regulator with XRE-family HTH domain